MSSIGDILRAAKENGDVSTIVEAIPYLRFLGFTADTSSGELIGKMAYADALIGNASLPALHGGTIGALMESTAVLQAFWESETPHAAEDRDDHDRLFALRSTGRHLR